MEAHTVLNGSDYILFFYFYFKVLPVSTTDLREITGDSETIASPLLCLSQSSTVDFLQPVKIQLPLPPGVTG